MRLIQRIILVTGGRDLKTTEKTGYSGYMGLIHRITQDLKTRHGTVDIGTHEALYTQKGSENNSMKAMDLQKKSIKSIFAIEG